MKLLILIFVCTAPIIAFGQISREMENAYYQVHVKGESAFYTDLHCTSAPFSKTQFLSFQAIAMEKEGVFDVQILENGNTIRVAHLSYVEGYTLKSFGLEVCDQIELEEREPYTF